jgi:hypothetical protein
VWRTLHNEELCDLYFSPNIIRVIQFTKRWGGHVAPKGERNVQSGFWWENWGKSHLEDICMMTGEY